MEQSHNDVSWKKIAAAALIGGAFGTVLGYSQVFCPDGQCALTGSWYGGALLGGLVGGGLGLSLTGGG